MLSQLLQSLIRIVVVDYSFLQQSTGMGLALSKPVKMLFARREVRMLMVGLDAAGKTTILYELKIGEVITTIPTIGKVHPPLSSHVTSHDGGDDAPCLITRLVSSSPVDSKSVSFTLWDVGGQDKLELQGATLLVFANKQDLSNAMSISEITDKLGLHSLRQRRYCVLYYFYGEIGVEDVLLKVLYCGLDHTDIHQMKNEIHLTNYPLVPGHEVVGEVVEVGHGVGGKFKAGDLVGIGGIVGSCGMCDCCLSNREQYCNKAVMTYNGVDVDGQLTRGGFASAMVVHHRFVVSIPEGLNPAQAAPLLCAGVTAYSPLRKFCSFQSNLKGAILGLGGVGHVGVLIAKAMDHNVTVISSSNKKKEEALMHLGADDYLVSSDEIKMSEAVGSFDYILDTIPAVHSIDTYLSLLKPDGKLLLVGAAPKPLQISADILILGRKTITGSFMGSIAETEEFLQFWAGKNLSSMIEIVPIDYVNKAVERIENNDVRYRFVLDVGGNTHA